MPNSLAYRNTTSIHSSDKINIWRNRSGLEEFNIDVVDFARLIGVPTEDLLNSIGENQIIDSTEATIQGFITNESPNYTLVKGDIITLQDGANRYSYAYTGYFPDGKTNPQNYQLLSYFQTSGYQVIIVTTEQELYDAMDYLDQFKTGEIRFGNDIQLTKNLTTKLTGITVDFSGYRLLAYNATTNASYYVHFDVKEFREPGFIGPLVMNTVFRNGSIHSKNYGLNADYDNERYTNSETVILITEDADVTPKAELYLKFEDIVFADCIGYDGGTIGGGYNIYDTRTHSGAFYLTMEKCYFYLALTSTDSKFRNADDYPFTIKKTANLSDAVFKLVCTNSSYVNHPYRRHSKGICPMLKGAIYDTVTIDNTYDLFYNINTEDVCPRSIKLNSNEINVRFLINGSATLADFYSWLPKGYFMESAKIYRWESDIFNFNLGLTEYDPNYFLSNTSLISGYNIHTNGKTSNVHNLAINPLFNNIGSVSTGYCPLYFSSIWGTDGYISIDIKLIKIVDTTLDLPFPGTNIISSTNEIVRVVDINMETDLNTDYIIVPQMLNRRFILNSAKLVCTASDTPSTTGVLTFSEQGSLYTDVIATSTMVVENIGIDLIKHTNSTSLNVDLHSNPFKVTLTTQSNATHTFKLIVTGFII
jgi:hypothetical protein